MTAAAPQQTWIESSVARLETLETQRKQLVATGQTSQLAELDEEIRSLYEALESVAGEPSAPINLGVARAGSTPGVGAPGQHQPGPTPQMTAPQPIVGAPLVPPPGFSRPQAPVARPPLGQGAAVPPPGFSTPQAPAVRPPPGVSSFAPGVTAPQPTVPQPAQPAAPAPVGQPAIGHAAVGQPPIGQPPIGQPPISQPSPGATAPQPAVDPAARGLTAPVPALDPAAPGLTAPHQAVGAAIPGAPMAPMAMTQSYETSGLDDIKPPRGPLLFIVIAVLVVGGGVGLFLAMSGDKNEEAKPAPTGPAKVIEAGDISEDTQEPKVAQGADADRTSGTRFKEGAKTERSGNTHRRSGGGGSRSGSSPAADDKDDGRKITFEKGKDPLGGVD